jgi:hypothetical protein
LHQWGTFSYAFALDASRRLGRSKKIAGKFLKAHEIAKSLRLVAAFVRD